jgi:hypothetical protein
MRSIDPFKIRRNLSMQQNPPSSPPPAKYRSCYWLLPAYLVFSLLVQEAWAEVPTARGGRFALLIAISNYQGLPKLPGPHRDIAHARAVAKAAGVPDNNIISLRDSEANGDGIRRALTDLALRLTPADRVLIYFSGLGSRRQDLDRPGGCEEVFLAADGEALGYGELAALVIPVAERAEKTAVFFDSCGTAQRGSGGLTARCVPAETGSNCQVNPKTRWRNFVADIRKAAVPTANIVSVHAGRPEETVFDDATGGLFTSAINRCGLVDSPDQDHSGAISLSEMGDCAQKAVDLRVGAGKGGQVTLNGNRGFVPFMLKAGGQGPIANLFEDIASGRDGRKEMVLENMRTPSGFDGPVVSLRSSAVGYLYLIASDGDGAARLVYPTMADGSNRIRAGETFVFPRKPGHSPLVAGSSLLAILADNERDLTMLPAAPGTVFAAGTNTRKALYDFATTSVRAAEAPCQASGQARNVSLWRGCSDAYGAAVIVIKPK